MDLVRWRMRVWQYCLPTLLLVGALVFLALLLRDPDAPVMIWTFLVAPPLAFLMGMIAQPVRVWVTPAAVVVLVAILFLTLTWLDKLHPQGIIGTLIIIVILVGLPLTFLTWLGRGVWLVVSDWWQRRSSGQTGHRSPSRLGS